MWIFTCFLFSLSLCATESESLHHFKEVWAYVMQGEEQHLKGTEPITDIAYFSAKVNAIGRVDSLISISKIPEKVRAGKKIHLVISAPGNHSLMYWCLSKDIETRDSLIGDIIRVGTPFDGVQIDFETIRPEDQEGYLTFLKLLRASLPKEKTLTVAVPARTKELEKDAFRYKDIANIADQIVIMAYDEHWRTGAPGAIASLNWCDKVLSFAKLEFPKAKLIMGIPLYGRAWQKQEHARALKYPQTLELWEKYKTPLQRDPDGTASFEYKEVVEAVVYFENEHSLCKKLSLYETKDVDSIAFWRVSQEPAALWKHLSIQK